MLNLIIRVMLLAASLFFILLAARAIFNADWPQACAFLLADISCTLTSISTKDEA